MIRCLADGGASIEYLRRDGVQIYQLVTSEKEEVPSQPSQMVLDKRERKLWQRESAEQYGE